MAFYIDFCDKEMKLEASLQGRHFESDQHITNNVLTSPALLTVLGSYCVQIQFHIRAAGMFLLLNESRLGERTYYSALCFSGTLLTWEKEIMHQRALLGVSFEVSLSHTDMNHLSMCSTKCHVLS